MAEKPEQPKKKTTAKPKKAADKSVLGSLPATRPERIGRERPPEAKPAAASTMKSTGTRAAKPRATAPRRAPAAPKAPAPAPEPVEAAPVAADRPSAATSRPRPVRAGAPGIAPGDGRDQLAQEEEAKHTGAEVAVGMIRAAGELTRLSISAWAEFVKRATRRR